SPIDIAFTPSSAESLYVKQRDANRSIIYLPPSAQLQLNFPNDADGHPQCYATNYGGPFVDNPDSTFYTSNWTSYSGGNISAQTLLPPGRQKSLTLDYGKGQDFVNGKDIKGTAKDFWRNFGVFQVNYAGAPVIKLKYNDVSADPVL